MCFFIRDKRLNKGFLIDTRIEAIPIWQQTAESCVKALIGWSADNGVPQIITSDRGGANFMSSLWNALADSLGTKIVHTTAYNPEANHIIERLRQSLKTSLTARCQGGSWRKELPWVLPGLRTSPHVAFDTSPAEALYRQALTLLPDIFQQPMSPTSPSDIHKALEQTMPAKTTYNMARKIYVSNEMQNIRHAFI
ncbi:uncharacterized protein [Macrobrachium rosenbergii]|uniref:uncharacterized protein n=1 Tax=Macrobrachium rosenbergii TaxID=79674 RepID=UPI0034D60109